MKRGILSALLLVIGAHQALAGDSVRLMLEIPSDSQPIRHAVDALTQALRQQKVAVEEKGCPGCIPLVIGLAGHGGEVGRLLQEQHLTVAAEPESLLIRHSPSQILLTGRDARGLMYAILEASEAIRLGGMAALKDARESPRLHVRSVMVQLFNADVERAWFESEEYWQGYFAMLARDRYNNFALVYGSQTNYRSPPYPWLFTIPEYPNVRVDGVGGPEQARNLRALRRIAEIATEHGVDFTIGLWTLAPMPPESFGPNLIRDFPAPDNQADYLARGLRRLLTECPAIKGVQFRVNHESGIPDAEQTKFFDQEFAAIKECGHPVTVNLRYKGLVPETVNNALRAGLDLTVSTKFWCEHMGLPFHPTDEEPKYADSRYGYGTLLAYPRSYKVLYQLWNCGSGRLLLWGDPAYAARFAESCRLDDGDGFEVCAPLTNKGFGDVPGDWKIFSDRSYDPNPWEYQRYWMQYLAFGRLGYNPQSSPDVWRREFRSRFGAAAGAIETAYRSASQILPLITVSRQHAAGEWQFWPEMSTCGPLESYAVTQPSDRAQFYPISRWRSVPSWSSEPWTDDQPGYVEDAVAGKLDGKWTPLQVSRRFMQLADETLAALAAAGPADSAERRSTELDFRILAQLARYHAAKLQAATHLEFFRVTKEAGRLPAALAKAREAAAAWRELARLTDGVYNSNLVFGHVTKTPYDEVQAGHWKDRLPEVDADVKSIEDLIAKQGKIDPKYRTFPGETPPAQLPVIRHAPVTRIAPSSDLAVAAEVTSTAPVRQVLLHYRPMDQTQPWKSIPMERTAGDSYKATIPSKDITARFDMLYYLEALTADGGTLWPDWQKATPYIVVKVDRTQ